MWTLVLAALASGGAPVKLTSPQFEAGGSIPAKHTCEGDDTSPALEWSGLPAGTKSVALIVDDPDAPDPAAPKTTWVHWVLYNLPADSTGLPEGVKALPEGTLQGRNDWKRVGFGGPCPPIGEHRYFHKLYALDVVLPDLREPTKAALLEAMEGHVLGQAELVGRYQKHGRK
ncbi:MAG: YbhB/YbcL family Raf kinase inhibitor-like protein [Alphaproteobacteria bacterium]|nr:YbhB/YbcL family Raf kinase inhibitor-like protein [Alphaproteobacteria bacterium]